MTASYPSPPRAEAVDSVVNSQQVESSTVYHSAVNGESMTAIPIPILAAAASVSTGGATGALIPSRPTTPFSPISFEEAMTQVAGSTGKSFRHLTSESSGPFQPKRPSGFEQFLAFLTCKACVSGQPIRLAEELEQDRDTQSILFNTPFNAQIDTHRQIMSTIYNFFISPTNIAGLSMVGEHWARLGFQSIDPSVEINRRGGILNLLFVVYLIEVHPGEARRWFSHFNDNGGTSFMNASMEMTFVAISCAKKGALNSVFNRERMLIPVTANLYCSLMRRLVASTGANTSEAKSIDAVISEISKSVLANDAIDEFMKQSAPPRVAGTSS